jgi:hypothetical protein
MAFVDPVGHPSDPIQQCFTSQFAASQATSGDCGISSTELAAGRYSLDFGFQVSDRFASATGEGFNRITSVIPGSTSNRLVVEEFNPITQVDQATAFYIIVY